MSEDKAFEFNVDRQELFFRLTRQCVDILAGHSPDIQGAVLADLTARYFIGMPPALREEIFPMHVRTILELIPVNERLLQERKLQ